MSLKNHLIPIYEQEFPLMWADKQFHKLWSPDEISLEKDVLDIKINLSESEKYGLLRTLSLFTLLETHAGDEYWGGRFKTTIFKDEAEFHSMASLFSAVELYVHTRFYKRINELLHVDTKEFYTSFQNEKILRERIKLVQDAISHKNDLVSLGCFSIVEGAMLYSQFAYILHFQANGKNKVPGIVSGINFSVIDENIHASAGAECFRYKMSKYAGDKKEIEDAIKEFAVKMIDQTPEINSCVFEKGGILGLSEDILLTFEKSRVNECFRMLGYPPLFTISNNKIADWFYKDINTFHYNDNFANLSREYVKGWNKDKLRWKQKD